MSLYLPGVVAVSQVSNRVSSATAQELLFNACRFKLSQLTEEKKKYFQASHVNLQAC